MPGELFPPRSRAPMSGGSVRRYQRQSPSTAWRARRASDPFEPLPVDGNAKRDPQLVFSQQIAERVPIDQVYGRCAVALGFLHSFSSENPGSDEQPFVSAASHSSAEVADG